MGAKFVYLPEKKMWVSLDKIAYLQCQSTVWAVALTTGELFKLFESDAKILQNALAQHKGGDA